MSTLFLLLSLLFCSANVSQAKLPFYFHAPDSVHSIAVVHSFLLSDSQRWSSQFLVGLQARAGHQPFLFQLDSEQAEDAVWLTEYARRGVSFATNITSFASLLALTGPVTQGYILACDKLATTCGYAVAAAATALGAVPVTKADEAVAIQAGLQLELDATQMSFEDAWKQFAANLSQASATLAAPSTSFLSHELDLSSASAAVAFWGTVGDQVFQSIAAHLNSHRPVFGWGPDEKKTVSFFSSQQLFVHASDTVANLALHSSVAVKPGELLQRTHAEPSILPNVHTVCFVITDGDNLAFDLGYLRGQQLWANPHRGSVSVGWTTSPALADVAPAALAYYYRTSAAEALARDQFIAGPSGLGYMYPSLYGNTTEFAALTAEEMKAADLHVVNVIDVNDSPVLPSLQPLLVQSNIDGILYYGYSDYSSMKGAIVFAEGKPVIGGRFNLWSPQFLNVSELAQALQRLPKDPTSADGYSVVPVHVWSHNLTDVARVVELLGGRDPTTNQGFRFVAPEELMSLVQKNIAH